MIFATFFALMWPPFFALAFDGFVWRRLESYSGTAAGAVIGFSFLLPEAWLPFAISGAHVCVALAIWWWRRRKKRRTVALLGHKAKARIEAMRQGMRERAKPRPALRPQRSPA